VYVDDVIIFSQTKEDHVKDIHWVLEKLLHAGMRVTQKTVAQAYATEIEDDLDTDDTCNFLE